MTSWNENIFRVTDPLCGEFTGDRWIPRTKASDTEHWCFLWSEPEQTVEQTRDTGNLRRQHTHYDATVKESNRYCQYRLVLAQLWHCLHGVYLSRQKRLLRSGGFTLYCLLHILIAISIFCPSFFWKQGFSWYQINGKIYIMDEHYKAIRQELFKIGSSWDWFDEMKTGRAVGLR